MGNLVYSLTADTTCFGKNNRLTQGNIVFLSRYALPLFFPITRLIDKKTLEGKFYHVNENYDFHLSSKWSPERMITELKKRLDNLPYRGAIFGTYKVKWEEDNIYVSDETGR